MTNLYVDYSFSHPSPSAIKAAGYSGAVRYISTDSKSIKNLTASERDSLHAAGLDILLVWETTSGRAGDGYAAGAQDVVAAEAMASSLGYPKDCPIFYAVDSGSLSPAAVKPYFDAVKANAHYPVGIYGSYVITCSGLATYNWQTCAWSGGAVNGAAHLYQRGTPTKVIAGGGYDENVLMNPVPAWGPIARPSTVVAKSPVPVAYNVSQIKVIQGACHVTADGHFGPISERALVAIVHRDLRDVRYLQACVGAVVDGAWGPKSESARFAAIVKIQIALGVTGDGAWGPNTNRAWYMFYGVVFNKS